MEFQMLPSLIGIVIASLSFDTQLSPTVHSPLPDPAPVPIQYFDGEEYQRRMVLNYFSELTGNRELTAIVMDAADRYEIPYTLAFALAYKESSFDPNQVSENESSVDRGLFQLNNLSFPDLEEQDFFDISINADRGMAYLRYCWNRGGNATIALAMYNAGPTRVESTGTPPFTMNYIHKIHSVRDYYDGEIEKLLVLNPRTLRDSVKSAKKLSSLIDQRTDIN